MILRLFSITLLASLMNLGCATHSKDFCNTTNWQRLGNQDGENGKTKESIVAHEKTCGRNLTEEEKSTYLGSWKVGNKKFCTAEGGYRAGVNGDVLNGACSIAEHADFFEQYKLGIQVHELVVQKEEINKQIQSSNDNNSVIANLGKAYNIWNGRSPTHDLDKRKELINEKISTIDNNAPGGPQIISGSSYGSLLDLDFSNARRDLGALTGTVVGFGVGHAIQGRYWADGWKWTLGEVGTIGLMGAVSNSACGDFYYSFKTDITGTITREKQCLGNGPAKDWVPVVVLTWVGFRIWQSYDLFTYPGEKYISQHQANQMVVVKGDGLAWIYQF